MPRPIRTLACAIAGLGLVAGTLTGPAAAAPSTGPTSNPALKLITKSQVAAKKGAYGPWSETPVIKGQYVQSSCATLAFPKKTTLFRVVFNDEQANAISQYAVKMSSVAAAKRLTNTLDYCFSKSRSERLTRGTPDLTITYRTWGDLDVEDGLLVRTQNTKYAGSSGGSIMSSVGRDGSVVMAMWWKLYDTSSLGPKDLWIGLSKKALTQLR